VLINAYNALNPVRSSSTTRSRPASAKHPRVMWNLRPPQRGRASRLTSITSSTHPGRKDYNGNAPSMRPRLAAVIAAPAPASRSAANSSDAPARQPSGPLASADPTLQIDSRHQHRATRRSVEWFAEDWDRTYKKLTSVFGGNPKPKAPCSISSANTAPGRTASDLQRTPPTASTLPFGPTTGPWKQPEKSQMP